MGALFSTRRISFLYNYYMKPIEKLCKKYNIALCYLFGSLQNKGKALLEAKLVKVVDPKSDIDFAVLFLKHPENSLETYACLSLDLRNLSF